MMTSRSVLRSVGCLVIVSACSAPAEPPTATSMDGSADRAASNDVGPGTDAGADMGTDAGADMGTDAGADMGTDAAFSESVCAIDGPCLTTGYCVDEHTLQQTETVIFDGLCVDLLGDSHEFFCGAATHCTGGYCRNAGDPTACDPGTVCRENLPSSSGQFRPEARCVPIETDAGQDAAVDAGSE